MAGRTHRSGQVRKRGPQLERQREHEPAQRSVDWAWATFVKSWHESRRFALEVHDGRKRGDGGRSICLGQIWGGSEKLTGTDLEATRRCYHEVLRHLLMHAQRCSVGGARRSAVSGMFAGYGTGSSCSGRIRWAQTRPLLWTRVSR